FTTEDIRTDNLAYTDGVIKKYLRRLFGCRRVVILEPIPGPVIKHVDMFLLPGRGKNLILAGYPSESYSAEQWGPLSAEVRALVEEADQVMDRNQRLLERAGYRVFRMRSPLPVEDVDMGLWFPTMLNGLPLPKGLGGTQVLLPRYRDVPPSYMDRSQAIFRQAFGADTELVPIESSGPGQWQGAVHCLTATVALDLTRFSELATETRFRERVADWFNAPISRDLEAFAGDWVATGDGKLNGYHVLSDMFGLSIVGNFVHMTMGDTPPVLAGVLEPCEGDTGWCFEPYFPGMTTTTLRVEVRGDGLRLEGTEGRPVDLRLRQGATEDPW
ncbi:MAG TPA: hypothetical protein PLA94_28715, partial [Myxococcota bacterium]|nr:hypothetical protein [Myxococcota bacterium]